MKMLLLISAMTVLCFAISAMAEDIPRPEHPRPDMQRDDWINMNGVWEFVETDDDNASYLEPNAVYPDRIIVPFCRESELSGLNRKHFVRNVWYRRAFIVPAEWREKRVLLHIGACDWRTRVWVNGQLCGEHYGGSAPITCDITSALKDGENVTVIHAYDDVRTGIQAGGKQSTKPESYGCVYTRTTGIWQTVWLECVGKTYIEKTRVYPDMENVPSFGVVGKILDTLLNPAIKDHHKVLIQVNCRGDITPDLTLDVEVSFEGTRVCNTTVPVMGSTTSIAVPTGVLDKRFMSIAALMIPPKFVHLWEPGNPKLYDLKLTLKQGGKVVDTVNSYFGIRSIRLEGRKFLINGKPVFQRLVLDQGFYPTGIWTAPSDAELKADIERAMRAGFNGARLHQKVFEPRFLYWADKLGYIVWGEFPDWGLNHKNPEGHLYFVNEWREIVERDFNHPSIIGWCPFNETPKEAGFLQKVVLEYTRVLDPTRPVLEASGWTHAYPFPMLLDAHDYEQDPVKFKEKWGTLNDNLPKQEIPFFISEYGGIGWNTEQGGWGYGNNPKTLDEFYERLKGLTDAILGNPYIFGFCYTQLTNIEQEQNGIYTYDRQPKFDLNRVRAIFTGESAYEKSGK